MKIQQGGGGVQNTDFKGYKKNWPFHTLGGGPERCANFHTLFFYLMAPLRQRQSKYKYLNIPATCCQLSLSKTGSGGSGGFNLSRGTSTCCFKSLGYERSRDCGVQS